MASNQTNINDSNHHTSRLPRWFRYGQWSGWQLVIVASTLHLCLAAVLFVVGRAQVAPGVIDRDGIMDSFAHDSYDYQRGASQLAEVLKGGEFKSWVTAAQPIHVKIISIPFAILGPLFGYSALSAEPYNLVCYAAIVGLVFLLGREISSRRAGLLAAALVAVWPTFLLHTTQLLKDPLFIAASLLFVLFATTSLTRTYRPVMAVGVTGLIMLLLLMLLLVRSNVVLVMFVVGLLSFTLLLVRQRLQKKRLVWNMVSPATVLLISLLIISVHSPRSLSREKQLSSTEVGPSKVVATTRSPLPLRGVVVRLPARTKGTDSLSARLRLFGNRFALRISSMRSSFAAAYTNSGSLLDENKEFRNSNDLARYVPRALEIGLLAPFPNTWTAAGRRVGNLGKLLSAGETCLLYLCEVFALWIVMREWRRLQFGFLLGLATLGAMALAFLIPNVGALYRFRYTFAMLIITVAMAGVSSMKGIYLRRRGLISERKYIPSRVRNRALRIIAVSSLVVLTACQSSQLGEATRSKHAANELETTANLDFSLMNFTGISLRGVYLSPTVGNTWQENLLGDSALNDGDTLNIRFNPSERETTWDMRIEGPEGRSAEWKNLDLGNISQMTIVLKPTPQLSVVAEVE